MIPGVPREMRGMLAEEVLPHIRALMSDTESAVISGTLRTTGIAESAIAEILGPNFLGEQRGGLRSLSLAYLPGVAGVDLRVTARGMARSRAEALVGEATLKLRGRVSAYVYGEGEVDLASVVIDQCRSAGLKLVVAESCTGGLLGERITNIPGSSDVFLGGVIAYHNDVKRDALGIREVDLRRYGAVSEEVAMQMARGVRANLGADVGIAVTGVAGPGGATADKPVGLVWIALNGPGADAKARRFQLIRDKAAGGPGRPGDAAARSLKRLS